MWAQRWKSEERLPEAIRVTILDPSGRTQAASTVVRLKITAPGVPKPDSKANTTNPTPPVTNPAPPQQSPTSNDVRRGNLERHVSHAQRDWVRPCRRSLDPRRFGDTRLDIFRVCNKTAGASHILDDRVQAKIRRRRSRNDGSPATLRSRENAPVSRRVHIEDRSHRRRCPLSL